MSICLNIIPNQSLSLEFLEEVNKSWSLRFSGIATAYQLN